MPTLHFPNYTPEQMVTCLTKVWGCGYEQTGVGVWGTASARRPQCYNSMALAW